MNSGADPQSRMQNMGESRRGRPAQQMTSKMRPRGQQKDGKKWVSCFCRCNILWLNWHMCCGDAVGKRFSSASGAIGPRALQSTSSNDKFGTMYSAFFRSLDMLIYETTVRHGKKTTTRAKRLQVELFYTMLQKRASGQRPARSFFSAVA
jgi:hypothetical protein